MKKQLTITLIVLALAIGGYYAYANRFEIQQNVASSDVAEPQTYNEISTLPINDDREDEDEVVEEPIIESPDDVVADDTPIDLDDVADSTASSVNLAVPFTSQAPHANWDLPYQEACEEASVLMAVSYYDDALVNISTPDFADQAILEVVSFETRNYNLYLDTSAVETKRFAEAMYPDYSFDLIHDPTVANITDAISDGYPVIVPASGRELGNPFFTGEGPLYHMLVVRGFTDSSFVTNDPGTRSGEAFVYKKQVLMDAIGDWNNGDPANGEKVVIVVKKK
jgi:hypothetical protein